MSNPSTYHPHHARLAAGLSLTAAAEAIGTSRRTLARWEDGQMSPPAGMLPSIIRAYQLSDEAAAGLARWWEARAGGAQ